MQKNLEDSERKVLGKIKRITCVIAHDLYVMSNALERSVDSEELLAFFNGNSNPLLVDWSPRRVDMIYPTIRIILYPSLHPLVPTLQDIAFIKNGLFRFFCFLQITIAKFVTLSNVILSLLKDCRRVINLASLPSFDKLRMTILLYFVIQTFTHPKK